MRVEEIIKSVEEGVNEPHIFKVPVYGRRIRGKFYIQNVERNRLKMVNSDEVFELIMNKDNLP